MIRGRFKRGCIAIHKHNNPSYKKRKSPNVVTFFLSVMKYVLKAEKTLQQF